MEVLEFVIVYQVLKQFINMNKIIFGNGILDQVKPNYIEVPYNVQEQIEIEFMKYIEDLLSNITGIPKDRIK